MNDQTHMIYVAQLRSVLDNINGFTRTVGLSLESHGLTA